MEVLMIFWRSDNDICPTEAKELLNNMFEVPVRAFDLMKFKERIEDDGFVILAVSFEGNNISFMGAKKESIKTEIAGTNKAGLPIKKMKIKEQS